MKNQTYCRCIKITKGQLNTPCTSFDIRPRTCLVTLFPVLYYPNHGLINYISNKAKRPHPKKVISEGTLRQVFIRVYRLEIYSVMLVFSTQLCVLFYPPNLLSGSTLPGGGDAVLGLSQINTCRKVPLQVNFLEEDILINCLYS
jgi:hypothetical protein